LIGVLEREADFFDEERCFDLIDGVVAGGLGDGFSGDEGEDGVEGVLGFSEVVDGGDVLVVEIREDADLLLEGLAGGFVAISFFGEEDDGDFSAECHLGGVDTDELADDLWFVVE